MNLAGLGRLAGKTDQIQEMGDLGQLLRRGLETAFAPLRLSIIAATSAVTAFSVAVYAAAKAGQAFANARLMSGGGTGNVAFLASLGLDPGSIAGIGANLRDTLARGGIAGVTARQLGSGLVLPKQFQPGLNQSELLQKVIKGLAGVGTETERFAKAVQMNQEALLPAVELYRRHTAAIDADTAVMQEVQDLNFQKASSDLVFNLGRIQQSFQQVMFAAAKPFLQPVAEFLGRVADKSRDLTKWLLKNQEAIGKVRDWLVELGKGMLTWGEIIGGLMANLGDMIMQLPLPFAKEQGTLVRDAGMGMAKGAADLKKLFFGDGLNSVKGVVQANTEAVMGNTAAFKQGTFGGGDRARRAVSQRLPGFLPENFNAAVAGQAYRLGAF